RCSSARRSSSSSWRRSARVDGAACGLARRTLSRKRPPSPAARGGTGRPKEMVYVFVVSCAERRRAAPGPRPGCRSSSPAPEGADAVEVALDFLTPGASGMFSGGASCTANLAVINWNQVLLYPKGRPAREMSCRASLRLPPAWKFGTALTVARQEGQTVEFE